MIARDDMKIDDYGFDGGETLSLVANGLKLNQKKQLKTGRSSIPSESSIEKNMLLKPHMISFRIDDDQ